MSLTKNDIETIREVFREEIQAVENDVKELYGITTKMQKQMKAGFKRMDANFAHLAKNVGTPLPYPSQ